MLVNKTKYKSYWIKSVNRIKKNSKFTSVVYTKYQSNDILKLLYIDNFTHLNEYNVNLQIYKRVKGDIFNLLEVKKYKFKTYDEIIDKFDLNNKKTIINNISDIYGD